MFCITSNREIAEPLLAEEAGHEFHGNQWTHAESFGLIRAKGSLGRMNYVTSNDPGVRLSAQLTPEAIFITRLDAVEPGTGKGGAALEKIKAFAQSTGRRVDLTAGADTPDLQPKLNAFYEKHGFTKTGDDEHPSYSWNPDKVVKAGRCVEINSAREIFAPLEAADLDAIDKYVDQLMAKDVPHVTDDTAEAMKQSLRKYFQKVSADKIGQFTDEAQAVVERTLKTMQEIRPGQTLSTEVGTGTATARTELTAFLEEATGAELPAKMNMDFFLRVAKEVAFGAGRFVGDNGNDDLVQAYPALELVRFDHVFVPRGSGTGRNGPDNGWEARWQAACDEAGDETAAQVFEDSGRMVALRDSDVWQALGDGTGGYEDTLGNPFAPFAFNSGMDTKSVSRADCIELGLMEELDEDGEPTRVEPAKVDFRKLFGTEAARNVPCSLTVGAAKTQAGRHGASWVVLVPFRRRLLEASGDVAGHPFRGNQWTGGTGGIAMERSGEKWVTDKGEEIPDYAKALGVPPAWKNVRVAPGPEHDLQAIGEDAKGRVQRIYSDAATQRAAAEKFSRNSELLKKQDYIFKQNEDNLSHEKSAVRENAACMKLIQQTGIRPGSDTDTGAEKQAYGATTLEGRHVHVDDEGNVRLKFVGKKGVDLDIPVEDKATAKMLINRKESAGERGKLFDTDDAKLRDYSHTLDGGSFKPKDFRTLKGTQTAIDEINKNPVKASTMVEYKKRVMDIAKKVAAKLGNTPTIALQSYINPFVFNTIKP